MVRILVATTGSLGDVNPMLAVAEQLHALGAEVVFAAPDCYSKHCTPDLKFVPIGSSEDYVSSLRYDRSMLTEQGFAQFAERLNFDHLEELYDQLLTAADGADAVFAPTHVVPAHLVAEKNRIPYIGCALGTAHLQSPLTLGASDQQKHMLLAVTRWHGALRKLREDKQLARRPLPLASLLYDARRILALLPPFLIPAGKNQLANLEVVGYAEHAQRTRMVQDQELLSFCDARTVAFSFGSFADACDPDFYFTESVAACRMLDLRCVYLSRHMPSGSWDRTSNPDVLLRADVAPGAVFPLVAATVHHGGTGTLMAACRAAKPMIVVPFFLDQPEHAARMYSLIGSESIPALQFNRHTAAEALQRTLANREEMCRRLGSLLPECRNGSEAAARSILSTCGSGVKLLRAAL